MAKSLSLVWVKWKSAPLSQYPYGLHNCFA